jgi:hypothetical protein
MDYYLWPMNADLENPPLPFNRIELSKAYPNPFLPQQRRSLSITAPWGFSLLVLDDVFEAILCGGAILAKPACALAISRGLLQWERGDDRKIFGRERGNSPIASEADNWQQTWDTAVSNRRRNIVGY